MTVYSILSLGIKARSHRLHDLFCTRSCCSPGLTCTFSAFPSSSFFFNDPSTRPLSWACNSLWGPGSGASTYASPATSRRSWRCANIKTSGYVRSSCIYRFRFAHFTRREIYISHSEVGCDLQKLVACDLEITNT